MASIDKVARETAERNRSGTTKKSEPVKKPRSEAVKKPKKAPVSGLELLRREADKKLRRSVKKIANLLEESAKKGKLDSAKFLVVLAEKRQPDPEPEPVKDTSFREWLAQLAREPEYEFPEEDGMGEGRDVGTRD